ncbi:hypothetical protein [Leifsonia shinshuensis]|uniref:DUF2384 domain-containing protein n=1 Tax=Leifsonia shinshuensis TaxID=150026 RepID=A0A7G6YA52_9MICO|nr:hypothetical protein [Leifsonia shinshuensis]QNE35367.1 hypothetical protein F1C12_09655 [Leifsonia shinshuensis]
MAEHGVRLQLTLTDDGVWRVTTGVNMAFVFDFHTGTVTILDDDLEHGSTELKPISAIEVGVPEPELSTEEPFLGPLLTEAELLERLVIGPETLRGFEEDRTVLRIITEAKYPAFQVVDGQLLPGLRSVLGELADGIDDAKLHWRWLTIPAEWADDRAPWELLRDGEEARVVNAAGRAAWAWRDQNRGYS